MDNTVISFQFSGEILLHAAEYEVIFPEGRRERFPRTMRLSDLADAIGAVLFDYHADIKNPILNSETTG